MLPLPCSNNYAFITFSTILLFTLLSSPPVPSPSLPPSLLFFFTLFYCLSFFPFFFFLSLYIPAGPPSLIRSLSTEPHVSESIRAESRRGRSFTEVNIKLHRGGREGERGGERGSPPSLIHRIDQAGMRVIYYFDKIRFSDAHRYPRRSIPFFLSFFLSFSPPQRVGQSLCVTVCVSEIGCVCARAFVCCCGASRRVHVHWTVDG